jgi:mitochondrial fission protein ELM1
MTEIKNEIWILADNRPGTFLQSVGLAEELGIEYKIIDLTYSIFSALPNFLLSNSLLRLSPQSQKSLQDFNYLPKIIISAGRKSAPIALYLRKKSGNLTKIIQIMNPNLNFKKFDFVILPKHDNIDPTAFPNLITTIGSLTKTNEKTIDSEKEKFSSEFKNIDQTKIALLVGGSSNKTEFDKNSAEKLAKIASTIAKNMDATLLILNSRRTSEEITIAIESNLNCDFKFFDWEKVKDNNPYLAIVGYSNFFIVTGDSVSMISECASTGKPLYIFDEKNISTKKHRRFHQNLFDDNYARKLESGVNILNNFSNKKLQETQRVALLIRDNIEETLSTVD